MISLDWKERLKKDTIDFYERKLPQGDYDIDIIYNAYPQRIDNKIPTAVITFVGKTLGSKMHKDADKYLDFFDFLLEHKGENGRIIYAYVMARAVRRETSFFLDYLEKFLFHTDDQKTCNLVIDKVIFPLFKKNAGDNLDIIVRWVKQDNRVLTISVQKLITKLINNDPGITKLIFAKLETSWLYATANMVKLNSGLLKDIYKIDPKFYKSIYENYHNTRNPIFAEILSGAICCYNKTLQEMVDFWSKSGNINLKKIGLHAQKILKKKK